MDGSPVSLSGIWKQPEGPSHPEWAAASMGSSLTAVQATQTHTDKKIAIYKSQGTYPNLVFPS